ncbi:MAG: hypothetical protein ABH843_06915 [Candidatus Omnitrophota bacterium]
MQTEVLTPSKERIKNILESKPADRLGILDLDIELYSGGSTKQSEKFYFFSFNGPFQAMNSELGLENALIKFTQEPRHTLSNFRYQQKRAIADYKRLKREGFLFDGAWIWEDIAYDKGLYFSLDKYQRQLLGIHKDIVDFFSSEGLPLSFHCDGNIQGLVDILAGINVKALHPVQELSNPNMPKIKDAFKGMMTFIGAVGLHRLDQERDELLKYINKLKESGNYIFSFDGPLPDGLDIEKYDELLKIIEAQKDI